MYRRITRRHQDGRWLARIGKVVGNKDLYLGHSAVTHLGRTWRGRPQMVYAYTSMTKVVNPADWSDDNHPECNNIVACEEYTNKSSLSLALDIFRVVNCAENGGEGYNLFNMDK